jgi:diguanylate cyclase (GGDEF)-like protein/PAS domain S-box-containing protein
MTTSHSVDPHLVPPQSRPSPPDAPSPTVFGDALRTSFDLASTPMVMLSPDGFVVRVNLRSAAMFGVAPEDALGKHWSTFAMPEDVAAVELELAKLVDGKRPHLEAKEWRVKRPDGEIAWFRSSTSALREDGQAPLLLVQFTDLGQEHRARAVLAEALDRSDQIEAMVRSSRSAIMATDVHGIVTTWNPAIESLLGWSATQVLGQPLARLFPGGGTQITDLIEETIRGMHIPRFATFFPREDGEFVAVDCDCSQVLNVAGECVGFSGILVAHDESSPDAKLRWVNTQQRLLSRMRQLISADGSREEVEDGMLTAIGSTTFSTHVLISDLRDDGKTMRLRTSLGWEPGEIPAMRILSDSSLLGSAMHHRTTQAVEDFAHSDEQLNPILAERGVSSGLAVPVLVDGNVVAGVGTYRPARGPWLPEEIEFVEEVARIYADAVRRWDEDAARRRMELHDPLTGLPTRVLMLDRLTQAIERDTASALRTALLVLDIDNFKSINDTLGHETGDRLLQALVPRMLSLLRSGDTLARLGGDEFIVVASRLEDESAAMLIAEQLLEAFSQPVVLDDHEHLLGVSIGLAVALPGADPQEILSDADAATYRAKELGRNRVEVFDRAIRDRVTARLRTERELRGAVERDELSLRYQPIVDLHSGVVEGFEALVRWQHPERGLVGPGDFIEIAEESGLIVGLGEWVLRTACEQANVWNTARTTGRPLRISVNLSARQLADGSVEQAVQNALELSGLPVTSLALEVTESVLVEQGDAIETLTRLRDSGVQIMLDDFGTGYSSLSYLRRFQVDTLKIDRSFVSELGQHRQDALLVAALVQMSSALGISAIAEGVETEQQAQLLRMLGCTLVQGFHFARPLTADAATALLADGGVVRGGPDS